MGTLRRHDAIRRASPPSRTGALRPAQDQGQAVTAKVEGFIAKARQDGPEVIIYDKDGSQMFRVYGEYVEHAPGWVAVRRGTRVLVYDRENSLASMIQQDSW